MPTPWEGWRTELSPRGHDPERWESRVKVTSWEAWCTELSPGGQSPTWSLGSGHQGLVKVEGEPPGRGTLSPGWVATARPLVFEG